MGGAEPSESRERPSGERHPPVADERHVPVEEDVAQGDDYAREPSAPKPGSQLPEEAPEEVSDPTRD